MYFCCARFARRRFGLAACGFATLVFSSFSAIPLRADNPATIVRVEEDWSLTLNEPEVNNNSPQVTCAMSPIGSVESTYMSFELNHQSQPDYATGGLHIHAWDGEYLNGSSHKTGVQLRTASEIVTWTQSMSLQNGTLTYSITAGTSDTWGTFGAGELAVSVASGLTNLNAYDVNSSVSASGVGYGSNRVASLILKKVRYITDAGDVIEVNVNQHVQGASQ